MLTYMCNNPVCFCFIAECQFGTQFRELGSTWFADLGPPFGVMYCLRCECVPVHKKRRIVARVQCKNIKNECPKPTCDEPILLPGRCCKTCTGENTSKCTSVSVSIVVATTIETFIFFYDHHSIRQGRAIKLK